MQIIGPTVNLASFAWLSPFFYHRLTYQDSSVSWELKVDMLGSEGVYKRANYGYFSLGRKILG